MILLIDTAGSKTSVGLFWPEKITKVYNRRTDQKSENLLVEIQRIFRQNKLKLKDIKAIVINQGPGSFTSLRVGISIANALGYALKIPVIGIKKESDIIKIAQKGYQKFCQNPKIKKQILPFYGFNLK